MDARSLQQVVDRLEPGKAFGILMFEHTWAIPLRDAIRRAGGVPLAQGFVTQEALVMVGRAGASLCRASHRSGGLYAMVLDILATLQEAEAIKTAIAADVVRTLAVAGLIEEAAVAEAIDTLAAAGKLEAGYLEAAAQAEAQAAAEDREIFAVSG
jgi:hypothetical protein